MLFSQNNFSDAKKIFEELISYDENADFALESADYIEKIAEEEKRLEELKNMSGATLSGEILENNLENNSTKNSNFWDE